MKDVIKDIYIQFSLLKKNNELNEAGIVRLIVREEQHEYNWMTSDDWALNTFLRKYRVNNKIHMDRK